MSKYVVDNSKPHLGGNLPGGDPSTFCPKSWSYIIEKYQIKSVTDIGSGLGHAANWFSQNGLNVIAIDGLEDNVRNSIYPAQMVDLTEKAFVESVDLVNCIEVVEHIEEKYLDNLLDTLCAGKYLLMTHAIPGQDGWHHVNCQWEDYWIDNLNKKGFILSKIDTEEIRNRAHKAKHIKRSGLFFIKQ
jgi:SAM-dependent methyltransferase